MMLGRDAPAVLGLLAIAAGTDGLGLVPARTCGRPGGGAGVGVVAGGGRASTSLNNMLREIADFNEPRDEYSRSSRSGASSPNWRKNQGYNLSRPTPPEMGGSFNTMRDAETNPYYDPGWAQSVRRDNPSQNWQSASGYNGYNDPSNPEMFGGSRSYRYPSTYPGMTNPRRTEKLYTNPTNPYYDPLWSQSYARRDEPIREGDHTAYYAPGYDRNYYGGGGMMGGGYGYDEGMMGGGGYGGGMMGGGYGGGGRMGGGGYGRGYGRGMYAAPPVESNKRAVLNGNSLMRSEKSTLFQSTVAPRSRLSSALQMAFYDGPMGGMMGPDMWDGGPPFDPMIPPMGYGSRSLRDYDGVTVGTMGANQGSPSFYRRGGRGGSNSRGVPNVPGVRGGPDMVRGGPD
eukprot:CAMPEP_0172531452 /NCGR_PEP_ID=MMETSP1067-20121228/4860_1 /TAXON_ID=265564 ORGANISM="Thalassiosira punctigera, Strain Tpunct2005C2" /NCGR_SAMPLE_ID=MMETSP1067 /ASSEMBLY_ACC=CAM_ASM_000444 /LENGTH=398 /DNA_ID=CAMNT_0013315835 /DNA_START=28 /DNA_END=1221 /DNA_ORIENTATION=+